MLPPRIISLCYITLPLRDFLLQTSLTRGLRVILLSFRGGPTVILFPSKSSAVAPSLLTTLVTLQSLHQQTRQGALLGDKTFKRAQAVGSILPVPSVLAVTPTKLSSVQLQNYGTTPNRPLLSAPINSSPCGMENWSAVNGNAKQAATAPPMIYDISVQVVPRRLMELKNVLELRKSLALTPYNSHAWESMLSASGLSKKYPSLPQNLRTGFLINMPMISTTQTPPNKSVITEYQHQFVKIVSLELFKQRYFDPFSSLVTESLIGPFQTSPFSIIPKPGKPERFRLIQNYSYPHNVTPVHLNPSINSFLNSDDFPTTWGTFSIISLLIHQLPPHSQVATREVAEAYRTIPLHHSQWPGTVVRTGEDAFGIDVMAAFGFSPSSGVYGNVADAGADLFRSQGIGPLAKWVDDHIFFRIRREFLELYNQQRQLRHTDLSEQGQFHQGGRLWYGSHSFPDGRLDEHVEDCQFPCQDLSSQSPRSPEDSLYTYNFHDIDKLSDILGIPWEKSKDQPFSTSTSYIGLKWDLDRLEVALTAEKRQKYSLAILDWHSRHKHDLNDVQKLYGKLLHACLVIPAGRSYLTSLESMLVLCSPHPFTLYSPVRELAEDLSWWAFKLSAPLSRPIPAPPLSMTSTPSQMQVLASALPSPSRTDGGHGISSLVGKHKTDSATSDGQKPLVSSSSSGQSHGLELLEGILQSMVITKESLRPGGISGVGIKPQTVCFAESTHSSSSLTIPSPSIQLIFPVQPTQQTPHPEVSIPQPNSCFLSFPYQLISTGSLLTRPSPTPPLKSDFSEKAITLLSPLSALTDFSRAIVPMKKISPPQMSTNSETVSSPAFTQAFSRFSTSLPPQDPSSITTPRRYLGNLTPAPSDLRPHCSARDRLLLWKPTFTRSSDNLTAEITDADLDRLITVINSSWQSTTRETYGAGLLVFHVFCDQRLIPEDQRCPADPLLMLTFISSCAGAYSGKTLANYFYAVRAWHTLHGAPW